MEALDIVKIAEYLVLSVVLVPSVLFTSKKALAWMRPKIHRPLPLFFAGSFFGVVGLGCVYLAYSAVYFGSVHCALRSCTSSYSPDQPFAYWTFVAMWYGFGILNLGIGVAGVRKAFSRP